MLKGFKDFLLRGNVLDLAVAVVVGAAFTAIVTAFTSNIINPFIAAVGRVERSGLGLPDHLRQPGHLRQHRRRGHRVINFVIIAAVVYFVLIVPANAAKKRFITEPRTRRPARPICSSRSATSSNRASKPTARQRVPTERTR